jgi:hypothetical protein
MASDYVRYGKASQSRGDLRVRPGVNPLTVNRRRIIQLRFGRTLSRLPRLEGLLRSVRG